jgi:hypothetical protein
MSNKKTIKCIMDTACVGGLTVGKEYGVLAEYNGMYSIVNDYDELGVYSEIFFDDEE